MKIDIIKKYSKGETLRIFNTLTSITEACNFFGLKDIPSNRKYIKNVAKEIEFDIDIFSKNRKGEPKKCLQCGKTLKVGQKKFCSSSCSATFNNKLRIVSESTKRKISDTLKQRFLKQRFPEYIERQCIICGKKFNVYRTKYGTFYKTNTCSKECKHLLMINAGKKAYKKSAATGKHRPWTTRNISSYAEKFFERVLNNNNIKYTREYYIKDLKYFLDFKIIINDKMIDLEIDGKQHQKQVEHDSIRDSKLKEKGYIIYRIAWNEINTDKGKSLMKQKIDDLLLFLKKNTVTPTT